MTRVTLGAALLLAAAGSAHAGDGWGFGFSVGFPIGDCGFGAVSIGTGGLGFGGGWSAPYAGYPYYGGGACYPAYPRYSPGYCGRGWYDDCDYPRYGRGYDGDRYAWRGRSDRYAEAAPARSLEPVTRVAEAKAVSPAEAEAAAWKALAAGDASAMQQFSRLVIAPDATSSSAMGYAIASAEAGQTDRAAWAARLAMKTSDPLLGVPTDEATRQAAAGALRTLENAARPGTRDAAVVASALHAVAGEQASAARSLQDAATLGEPVATLASLGEKLGVPVTAARPDAIVTAR